MRSKRAKKNPLNFSIQGLWARTNAYVHTKHSRTQLAMKPCKRCKALANVIWLRPGAQVEIFISTFCLSVENNLPRDDARLKV